MSTAFHADPFPYAVTGPVIDPAACERAHQWMSEPLDWEADDDGVHRGYRYRGEIDGVLEALGSGGVDVRDVARSVVAGFGAPLSDTVRFGVLRQGPGQGTNVHNDLPIPGRPTHRVILYLDTHGVEYEGGRLNIHRERDPGSVAATYTPVRGGIVGFEASRRSFHSVEPIVRGQRTVLLIYFYHVGAEPGRAERLQGGIDASVARLSEREQAAVRHVVDEHLARDLGRGSQDASTLRSTFCEAAALLVRFDVPLSTALDLVGNALTGGTGRPGSGRSRTAEEEALLWWAIRLSAQTRAAFTAEAWRRDLAMLRERPVDNHGLVHLLSGLYGGMSHAHTPETA